MISTTMPVSAAGSNYVPGIEYFQLRFTGSVHLITHFTPGYWDESTTILSWRVILCMLLITVIILTGCSGVHGPCACFDHRFQSSQDHLCSECPPVCGCIQTQCLPVSQEPKRAF